MIRGTIAASLMILLAAAPACWAQDEVESKEKPKSDPVAEKLKKIAELGPGVHAIKTDKKGRIQSCIVVGESRINTTLGKAKGLQEARKRAELSSQAAFVKWIKSEVSVHESQTDETTLFVEGSKGNDEDALRESGKAIEKSETRIDTVAKGMVRGFQMLHSEVKAEDETLTLVYGWKSTSAQATRGIEQDEADGKKNPKTSGSKAKGAKKKDSDQADKKVKDKSTSADDAGEFLPK